MEITTNPLSENFEIVLSKIVKEKGAVISKPVVYRAKIFLENFTDLSPSKQEKLLLETIKAVETKQNFQGKSEIDPKELGRRLVLTCGEKGLTLKDVPRSLEEDVKESFVGTSKRVYKKTIKDAYKSMDKAHRLSPLEKSEIIKKSITDTIDRQENDGFNGSEFSYYLFGKTLKKNIKKHAKEKYDGFYDFDDVEIERADDFDSMDGMDFDGDGLEDADINYIRGGVGYNSFEEDSEWLHGDDSDEDYDEDEDVFDMNDDSFEGDDDFDNLFRRNKAKRVARRTARRQARQSRKDSRSARKTERKNRKTARRQARKDRRADRKDKRQARRTARMERRDARRTRRAEMKDQRRNERIARKERRIQNRTERRDARLLRKQTRRDERQARLEERMSQKMQKLQAKGQQDENLQQFEEGVYNGQQEQYPQDYGQQDYGQDYGQMQDQIASDVNSQVPQMPMEQPMPDMGGSPSMGGGGGSAPEPEYGGGSDEDYGDEDYEEPISDEEYNEVEEMLEDEDYPLDEEEYEEEYDEDSADSDLDYSDEDGMEDVAIGEEDFDGDDFGGKRRAKKRAMSSRRASKSSSVASGIVRRKRSSNPNRVRPAKVLRALDFDGEEDFDGFSIEMSNKSKVLLFGCLVVLGIIIYKSK